jgi:Domain of unknown function (DUF2383)
MTVFDSTAAPMTSETQANTRMEAAAVKHLHNLTIDALRGYDKMVEKAEPAFRPTVQQFHDLHARHDRHVKQLLSEMGHEVDDGGTFMGTINEAVVAIRAFVDEIDHDVMKQIRSGEDWVMQAFDTAIAEQRGSEVEAKLREMRFELSRLLTETQQVG